MGKQLDGKVAIITGASRGIGESIAITFAREGAKLVLASRNKYGGLDEVSKEAQKTGVPVKIVPAHLGKAADLDNLVNETLNAYGRIDILVNNAGTNPILMPVIDIEERTWDQIMNVNLKGTFLLSQKVARVMVKQKNGSIVNVTSGAAIKPEPRSVAYSISKAGIMMLTMGMARELGEYGIRVNAVAPGVIQTKFTESNLSTEAARQDRIDRTTLKRLGNPEDIAEAVAFLASDKASFITGQTLVVDGGRLLI